MNLRMLVDFYGLKKNLRLKPPELRRMQEKKLRAIVSYAYENVSFYHRKFRMTGIKPSDIETVEDLVKIPITTKEYIQTSPLRRMIAKGVDVDQCFSARVQKWSLLLDIYM